jgi:hypothetical protein
MRKPGFVVLDTEYTYERNALTRVAGVYAPIRQALSVPEGYVVHGGLMLGERKYSYRLVPPRNPLRVQWV